MAILRNMNRNPHPAEHTEAKVREKHLLSEKRCSNCNQLLMNHKVIAGRVEIKCSRCGVMNVLEVGAATK